MASFDWVLQPPQTDKYTFLVDDLNDSGDYGRTTDLEKFNYNRKLMGVNFNLEVGVNTALSDAGISAVLPLGRFITIFQISRNEQAGVMTFINYQINLPPELLEALLSRAFSPDLVSACLELQKMLDESFTPSDDIVQLERL